MIVIGTIETIVWQLFRKQNISFKNSGKVGIRHRFRHLLDLLEKPCLLKLFVIVKYNSETCFIL